MKISFSPLNHYSNITYKIKWNLDTTAKIKNNVESLNDFREARTLINKIKRRLPNR